MQLFFLLSINLSYALQEVFLEAPAQDYIFSITEDKKDDEKILVT